MSIVSKPDLGSLIAGEDGAVNEVFQAFFDDIEQSINDLLSGSGGAEINDLTVIVTWANVPDANITVGSVTQHEGSIDHDQLLNFLASEHFTEGSIDHTAITNIGSNSHALIDTHIADSSIHFLQSIVRDTPFGIIGDDTGSNNMSILEFRESDDATVQLTVGQALGGNNTSFVVNHQTNGQILIGTDNVASSAAAVTFIAGGTEVGNIDPNRFRFQSELDIQMEEKADHSATPVSGFGLLWVRNDSPNVLVFTDDTGVDTVLGLASAEINDLSAVVTWANVPNANITEASVTQHEAALSITESQISDLFTTIAPLANPVFTGSFASPGIDDNATGERLQISNSDLTIGTAGAIFAVFHAADDQFTIYSGGSSSVLGGVIQLYGSTHASQAGDINLKTNTTIVQQWDESAGTWAFFSGSGGSKTLAFSVNSSQKVLFEGEIESQSTAIFPAATTSIPSIRLPHGAAPTTPTDGDMWTTTAGLFVRVNGSTIGPLS